MRRLRHAVEGNVRMLCGCGGSERPGQADVDQQAVEHVGAADGVDDMAAARRATMCTTTMLCRNTRARVAG